MIGCAVGAGWVLSAGFQSHRGLWELPRPPELPSRSSSVPGSGLGPEQSLSQGPWRSVPVGSSRRALGGLPGRPGKCEGGSQARGQLLQAARPGVRASAVNGLLLIIAPGSTRAHSLQALGWQESEACLSFGEVKNENCESFPGFFFFSLSI